MDGAAVAGEVVTAGTALAGFIIIYIGNLVNAFEARNPGGERNAVRVKFLLRAWGAFAGFILAITATVLAVIGKWLENPCTSHVSIWFLLFAFAAAVFATVQTIREMH